MGSFLDNIIFTHLHKGLQLTLVVLQNKLVTSRLRNPLYVKVSYLSKFEFLRRLTLLPARRRGVNLTLPSGLFKRALKPFELRTYKCVTFPKYEFNMLSSIFWFSIFWVYSSCTFRNPSPNFPSSHLFNSPLIFLTLR